MNRKQKIVFSIFFFGVLLISMVITFFVLLYWKNTKLDPVVTNGIVQEKTVEIINGSMMKRVNGILIVNKKYGLPANYDPNVDEVASKAVRSLQTTALTEGHSIEVISGYRDYNYQVQLYNEYLVQFGEEKANRVSAKPGHSEHQTGMSFDVGKIESTYGETPAGIWLSNNCHRFGFIIRYPKDKEAVTKYQYEPWHIRYVGEKIAKEIMERGITLEEYFHLEGE